MTNYRSEVADIDYNADVQCVQITWKGYASSKDFRNPLNAGLDILKENQAERWMANTKNLGVISPEDQDWTSNNWFPRAIEAGSKKMALIKPSDVFSQISIEDIMEEARKAEPLEDKFFEQMEEALSWLAQ